MTDTTPEPVPVQPTKLQRIVHAVQGFIAQNLAPNRVVLYLTTAADVLAVVLSLASSLNATQLVPVIAALAAINAKALMFVKGHQNMETALYQRDLIAWEASVQADASSRAIQAARGVGKAGSKPPGLTLPR